MVTFVFSNPRHHLEIMVPVAKALATRGVASRFVSLAELRGFETPQPAALGDLRVDRVLPWGLRKDPSIGAGLGERGGLAGFGRRAAQQVVWHAALGPRLRWLLRHPDLVVVPNDVAYPYGPLVRMLRDQGVPFALLQEGIRFPLPTEQAAGAPYGAGGADAICAWGEASAEHFRRVTSAVVHVTGNPRWDEVVPEKWEAKGTALRERLGLKQRPLLYLSNTIDDQGFCTTAQKMELFARFVDRATSELARAGRGLVVKLHPREDVDAFRTIANKARGIAVHVIDAPLNEVLACGQAAVVLASTVGLEALAFGLPLGVLALPVHGHVFEYVSRGAALGLTLEQLPAQLPALLATQRGPTAESAAFVDRHLAFRGEAAHRIAMRLLELRGCPSTTQRYS